MSDILKALEGLDATAIEAVNKPEVLDRLAAYIEASKSPLVAKNSELVSEKNSLKKAIEDFGGLDSIKTMKSDADKLAAEKQEALAKSGDIDAFRLQAAKALQERDKIITDLQSTLITDKVNSAVVSALAEAKGDAKLLTPHLMSRVKGELVDGRVQVRVLAEDGTPFTTKDMKDGSLSDLVSEFRKSFPVAFEATQSGGSGARGASAAGTGVMNPWAVGTVNMTEQHKMMRADPEMAKALAASAGIKLAL